MSAMVNLTYIPDNTDFNSNDLMEGYLTIMNGLREYGEIFPRGTETVIEKSL